MDIHPLIVHFPVAFLSVYALFEVFQTKKLKGSDSWFFVKGTLILFGTVGAYLALFTGDIAKELQGTHSPLVNLHETFAQGTTIIFSLLLLHYLFVFFRRFDEKLKQVSYGNMWSVIEQIEKTISVRPLIVVLACLGFVGIFVVGALGGAIVYGSNADPFVSFVYNAFF